MMCPQQYARFVELTNRQENANTVFVFSVANVPAELRQVEDVSRQEYDFGDWFGRHLHNYVRRCPETFTRLGATVAAEQQDQNVETARRLFFQYSDNTAEAFACNQDTLNSQTMWFTKQIFLQGTKYDLDGKELEPTHKRMFSISLKATVDIAPHQPFICLGPKLPEHTPAPISLRHPDSKTLLFNCCHCWGTRIEEDQVPSKQEKEAQQLLLKEHLQSAARFRRKELRLEQPQAPSCVGNRAAGWNTPMTSGIQGMAPSLVLGKAGEVDINLVATSPTKDMSPSLMSGKELEVDINLVATSPAATRSSASESTHECVPITDTRHATLADVGKIIEAKGIGAIRDTLGVPSSQLTKTNSSGFFSDSLGRRALQQANSSGSGVALQQTGAGVTLQQAKSSGALRDYFGVALQQTNSSGASGDYLGVALQQTNSSGAFRDYLGVALQPPKSPGAFREYLGAALQETNSSGAFREYLGVALKQSNSSGAFREYLGAALHETNSSGALRDYLGMALKQSNSSGAFREYLGVALQETNSSGALRDYLGMALQQPKSSGAFREYLGVALQQTNNSGAFRDYLGMALQQPKSSGAMGNWLGISLESTRGSKRQHKLRQMDEWLGMCLHQTRSSSKNLSSTGNFRICLDTSLREVNGTGVNRERLAQCVSEAKSEHMRKQVQAHGEAIEARRRASALTSQEGTTSVSLTGAQLEALLEFNVLQTPGKRRLGDQCLLPLSRGVETSRTLYLAPSPVHGWGVWAAKKLKRVPRCYVSYLNHTDKNNANAKIEIRINGTLKDFLPWAQGVSPRVLTSLAWERPSRDSQPLNKRLDGFSGLSALQDLLEDLKPDIQLVIMPLQDIAIDQELLIYYSAHDVTQDASIDAIDIRDEGHLRLLRQQCVCHRKTVTCPDKLLEEHMLKLDVKNLSTTPSDTSSCNP
eukprot:g69926.t1